MKENKRTTNIILRVTELEKNVIDIKSKLFNRKTSDYLRHSAFSHWENIDNTKHFKELLKMYQDGDEALKKEVVEILFQHYRRTGFPHNYLTDAQKENRLGRVINPKDILLEEDHLQMNHQGIDLANHFHPHMMEAYYSRGDNSPMETYNNDEKLRDCINRWLEIGKVPNPAGMRRILKTRNGTRGVVNFKPVIAKFIYDNYASEGDSVLDPCAGYGGRLVGCIATNKNLLYHGIDPNGETAVGDMRLASFFSNQYDALGLRIYKYRFRFDLGRAEEIMPKLDEKYNLIFTSPPYFNTEIYSDSGDQSSHKYQEYEEWKEKFLFILVKESYRLLEEGGYLVLNVKNTDTMSLADDLCRYCEKDWILEKTYHMRLSNNEYNRKDGKTFHTEPIFVFRKK